MTTKKTGFGSFLRAAVPVAVILVALVVLINALASGRTAPVPSAFAAGASLDEAVVRAREEGRVVFAVATADWCGPCQSYKRGALANERVASWLEANGAPVVIDVTSGPTPVSDRLAVTQIPASFVINGAGEVVARWTGELSASELRERLDASKAMARSLLHL